jgi:hypothetical protein
LCEYRCRSKFHPAPTFKRKEELNEKHSIPFLL